MKLQYTITDAMLASIQSISQNIGEINTRYLYTNDLSSKKEKKLKRIYSFLQIEKNSLSEDQLSLLLDNEKEQIDADKIDILEALNFIKIYKLVDEFKFHNENDFLMAHTILMKNILKKTGKYRNKDLIIAKEEFKFEYIAPDSEKIPNLMKDIFKYLKDKSELSIIKACFFHYEMERIYPFFQGNALMRRFWANLILSKEYPIFEILSLDKLLLDNKDTYYNALDTSIKLGDATIFIEYMLNSIDLEFSKMLEAQLKEITKEERLNLFLNNFTDDFTRKNYMTYFSFLSPATASRDLKFAVDNNLIEKKGDRMTTSYRKK